MSFNINEHTLISDIFNVSKDASRDVLEFKESKNKIIVHDPGLCNVSFNRSDICEVNQSNGKLSYRGSPIEEKIDTPFIEVAFELLFKEENKKEHFSFFKSNTDNHFKIYPEIKPLLDSIPLETHPMDFLAMGILGLSSIENRYLKNTENRYELASFIIAQVSVIATYYHNRLKNLEWKEDTSSEDFSKKIIKKLNKDGKVDELSKILNVVLNIHAEHGQNCSTSTVRNIASAKSTIYSALSSGIAAFKGLLHGGASQFVSEMYEEILENDIDYNDYIDDKIRQKKPLLGFGQRTYNRILNCWDPRVEIMLKIITSPSFDFKEVEGYRNLALCMIDRVASDEHFNNKNITPNPDLFNCIFYKLFNVPSKMNPVMITLGRVAGWMANYFEHIDDGYKLTRPCDLQK